MTSSPGVRRRSPSLGEVRALSASKLAEDPEFTRDTERTPTKRARFRSKLSANRPVVNQASSAESTTALTSAPSITFPDTGTGVTPGINSLWTELSETYCTARSRICLRSWDALSDMAESYRNHNIPTSSGALHVGGMRL